ncbi:MAG: DUF2069 domain-containing protein [Idiomarina sp.]|nr:DUF2069 domain-containing protein [Idiomarina sp.]
MFKSSAFYRQLTLISYPALLLWVIIWHGLLAPSEMVAVWLKPLVWALPLLFPLKGILQGNPYTHAWANFVLMLYFVHSLATLWTHPAERGYALIELILTTAAFIGATYYARYAGREQGLGIKKKGKVTNAGKAPD